MTTHHRSIDIASSGARTLGPNVRAAAIALASVLLLAPAGYGQSLSERIASVAEQRRQKEAKNESDVGDVERMMDVDDIRKDIENKCNALQAFCDDATLALRSELKIQLLKMPKKVSSRYLPRFLLFRTR